MQQSRFRTTLLFAAMTATLVGCHDNQPAPVRPAPPPQVQMTQACGQNVQTGEMQCVAVPVGSTNPYAHPAPQQYYRDNGISTSDVIAGAAIAGAAGYMLGRNSSNTTQAPAYDSSNNRNYANTNNYQRPRAANYATTPNPVAAAPTAIPAPAFQPKAAAVTATNKPMSIPPSKAASSALPVSLAKQAPASRPTFSPTAAAPRSSFTPTAAARSSFKPTPSRSVSGFKPKAARSSRR